MFYYVSVEEFFLTCYSASSLPLFYFPLSLPSLPLPHLPLPPSYIHTLPPLFSLPPSLPPSLQWSFIGIASTSSLLYLGIFLLTLARVLRGLRSKQKELSSLTPSAQQRFSGLFLSLRFFLVVTLVVAVCSVLTVVLPSEVMLHQWQHHDTEYNVYSTS